MFGCCWGYDALAARCQTDLCQTDLCAWEEGKQDSGYWQVLSKRDWDYGQEEKSGGGHIVEESKCAIGNFLRCLRHLIYVIL